MAENMGGQDIPFTGWSYSKEESSHAEGHWQWVQS